MAPHSHDCMCETCYGIRHGYLTAENRPGTRLARIEEATISLLQAITNNSVRSGLEETPARMARAWVEWTAGYHVDIPSLFKVFEDGAEKADEFVIVHNVPIISKCEHHLADITGIAHVAYIPNGKVVGLSKLVRVADAFSRRLQVQERLTNQIADAIDENLKPQGVGVIVRAAHGCMSTRGVSVHGSTTTTVALRGALRNEPATRAEFLTLCQMAEK